MKTTLSTTVWVRPGSSAAYPSLRAAQKGMQDSPAEVDQVYLRKYEVPAEDARILQGVLTDEKGKIERSLPKRMLDGICAIGSFAGAAAALGGAICCASSFLGMFIAGDFLQGGAELGMQGFRQVSRAVTGQSSLATAPAQERANAYFDKHEPLEMLLFDSKGEQLTPKQ